MIVGLCSAILPVEEQHAQDISQAKLEWGRFTLNVDRSAGRGVQYIVATLRCWGVENLWDMGVEAFSPMNTITVLREEDSNRVLAALCDFWRTMVAMEYNMLRHWSLVPPKCCFALLDSSQSVKERAMSLLTELFYSVELYEREGTADVREQVRSLEWPLESWARELLLAAGECEWSMMPQQQMQELQHLASSLAGTKAIEDVFNCCRVYEGDTKNKMMDTTTVWFTSYTSDVLEDASLEPVGNTECDRMHGERVAPKIYEAVSSEADCSLPQGSKERFLEKKDAVPRSSPGRHSEVPYGTYAMLHCTPKEFATAFLSLLVEPGVVIYHSRNSQLCGYVLEATRHGLLVWKGEAQGVGNFRWWQWERSDDPCQQLIILDPDHWRVLEVTPRTPTWVYEKHFQHAGIEAPKELLFQLHGVQEPNVLRRAAAVGFKQMTWAQMSALHTWLGLDGAKPPQVAEMAAKLYRHVYPDATEEQCDEALEKRAAKHVDWRSVVEDTAELLAEALKDWPMASPLGLWLCFLLAAWQ